MKVLIYSHEFPPFRGGAGTYSYDLATGLTSLGIEVHVAAPQFPTKQDQPVSDWKGTSYKLHFLPKGQKRTFLHLFLLLLQAKHSFDVVIVSERRAQEIIATLPQGYIQYATMIYGTEVLDYFGNGETDHNVTAREMGRFYENACVCITISYATLKLAKELLRNYRVNLSMVHCGINVARFPAPNARDTLNLRDKFGKESEIVFCLGRLDLDKGHETLISAFGAVREECPKALLLIGGDGPKKRDLINLRDSLGLRGCVEFLGEIPQSELPGYFDMCNLFALISRSQYRWEGFGLVYLEAGYYGKAVIGGNEGGVPEAISHQLSGIIVNPLDKKAIIAAIISLLKDETLATELGRFGKARVLEYFNSDRMASEVIASIETSLKIFPSSGFRSPLLNIIHWMVTELPVSTVRWLRRVVRKEINDTE